MWFNLKQLFFYVYECFTYLYVCVPKCVLDRLEMELVMIGLFVLGPEPMSSARAASAVLLTTEPSSNP